MIFCTACGHPRNGPVGFCAACGAPFPDSVSGEPAHVPAASGRPVGGVARQDPFGYLPEPRREGRVGLSELFGGTAEDYRVGRGEPRDQPPGLSPDLSSAPRGRRKVSVAALAAAVILVAAAGGVDVWLTHRPHRAPRAAPARTRPAGTVSPGTSGSGPKRAPSPAPTAAPAPALSESVVTVARGVRQNPDAARVENFLVGYFTAINGHKYQKFRKLLGRQMRQQEPAARFYPGYESTADSAAVLTGISDISPGLVGAAVSFTSHQLPAGTPSHSACTNWSITLYLSRHGGRYLLELPPPGYRAVYQPC
jgi:hypothetical protein